MNKSADYRLGWTKYSDLYFPPKLRLDLVSLRVFVYWSRTEYRKYRSIGYLNESRSSRVILLNP